MEKLRDEYNVSRETIENLITFQNMVLEWNDRFNLISKSSESDCWNRHIIDSLQLVKFMDKSANKVYDLGSGAGFPGIVLAIAAKELFPNLKVYLIESIRKKAKFLEEAKEKLKINVEIKNERIENLAMPPADIITSRALASLDKLLEYSKPFCSSKTKLIFLKGEKWKEEIICAEKKWNILYKAFESKTNNKGCVVYIENIRRKK